METPISFGALEELYEQAILPQFGLAPDKTTWTFHKQIGPDNDVHAFARNDAQFALLYEDYPTLSPEEIAHALNPTGQVQLQPIPRGTAGNLQADKGAPGVTPDNMTLRFGSSTVPSMHAHNITGYYRLFEIIKGSIANDPAHTRQHLRGDSDAYSAFITLGLELVALAQHTPNLSHIEQMAYELATLAKHNHFDDLHSLFFDIYLDECGQNVLRPGTTEEYFRTVATSLEELASTAHINPAISVTEQELLNTYTLPIHRSMAQHPEKSPELFIKLANELDELITKNSLSYWAAGQELSFALDRPQIISSKQLAEAVQKAYALELPRTLVQHDAATSWQAFMQTVRSVNKRML